MTTRAALFQAVLDYTRRTDTAFIDALPTMLRNFEARLAREVVHSSQVVVTTLVATGRSVELPTDCLEVRSVSIAEGRRVLQLVTPEVLREGPWWDASGDPQKYTIENRALYLAPAPNEASLDLSYYARFPAMAADADTTYVLTNFFDLYLYGMLSEAAKFIQDREALVGYEGAYVDIRRALLQQDIDFRSSGSAMRRLGSRQVV